MNLGLRTFLKLVIKITVKILPHREIHRPDGEKRECVNLHHDGDEGEIENDFEKAHDQLGVKQVNGFVFPRILALQIHKMQRVFHHNI